MAELKLPTEKVSLPSKGLLYPKDSPLAKGEIEMKYMTAKEEDILTNANYIKQGVVIDKLLQSLIVTPINYDELLIGDKNAILIAARILGYGKDYTFKYMLNNQEYEATVDLSTLDEKAIDENLFKKGANDFSFTLPKSGNVVTLPNSKGFYCNKDKSYYIFSDGSDYDTDVCSVGVKLSPKYMEENGVFKINQNYDTPTFNHGTYNEYGKNLKEGNLKLTIKKILKEEIQNKK
jgi:hypothetical protein